MVLSKEKILAPIESELGLGYLEAVPKMRGVGVEKVGCFEAAKPAEDLT